MPRAGRLYAVGDLRVGVDRIKCGFGAGRLLDGHRINVAVDDRALAGEFVFELDGFNKLVEVRGEIALVFRGVLRLQRADRADRLNGGRFVSASDHRLPRGNAHADQQGDDGDDDHQFDQVETGLILKVAA